jgi:UDPglucose 6-dehydrogenase
LNVGWIGLGHLGLPCALALEYYGGHQVVGYDVSPLPARILAGEAPPPREEGIGELLAASRIKVLDSAADVVAVSDIVFVAVQTPHSPAYGGEVPVPAEGRDFEYAFLVQAVRDVCRAAREQRKPVTVAVISTVLPGTMNRLVRPLLNAWTRLVYTPHFIAMGTTIADFRAPEFVICGTDGDRVASNALRSVLAPVHGKDLLFCCDIETAEAIKIFYNTAISVKVVLGNAIMEVCHKTGADCDVVIDALEQATDRVISPKYLRGGMGDGGGCHPRDNQAMSHLARQLELSYDLMGEIARARDAQTEWIAELAIGYAELAGLPIVILGKAYKPGSNLTAGSPALLLARLLRDWGHRVTQWDPYTDTWVLNVKRGVYVVATRHPDFARYEFPAGSVVLDPWGYMPDQPGVTTVRIGRKS